MPLAVRQVCLFALMLVAGRPPPPPLGLRSGDVVFHTSRSDRSALIRKASGSPYSHVGVVEVAPDGVFVLEAIQPVSRTPWARWVARGEGHRVRVMRAGLDSARQAAVVRAARASLGRPYDIHYRWDDERLYCSELVVKAFLAGAGLELGTRERLDALHLSAAELELARRAGLPPDLVLVTPASLASDPRLTLVAERAVR